jgi:hypothetical protein
MKITKLLAGLIMLVALISCRTQKGTQTNFSQVETTTESSKQTLKGRELLQQVNNSQLDTSNTNEQSDYEIESVTLQYPALDSNGKKIGNVTYTVTKEKGKKVKKESKTSKQTAKENTTVKEKETSDQKSKAVSDSTGKNKNRNTIRTGGGGGSFWLTVIIIVIVLVIIVVIIIRRKLKKLPLPLLCIAVLLFAACKQKTEAPPVEIKQQEPVKLTLLDIARQEIGKKEKPIGSNWGPDVQKYLNSVDLTSSNPWCMAYIYWTVQEYCNQYEYTNPLFKTGHVATQWRQCKPLRVANPQPEDIFIMIFKNGTGHCGLVDSVSIDGKRVYTIEGNTNTDGSRNGYMVCRQTNGRLTKTITGFIRVLKE